MENNVQTQKKFHYAWIILVAMCGIMIGTMGTVSSCMGIFTPSVAEDLGVPVTAVALYFTIRTLTMAVFQPVAGILFNKIDIRLLIGISVLLSNGGMMLMSQFHHIWGWYICAVINGIGLAFICYLLIPIVLNNWFKTNLSLSIGLATACSGIGGAIFSPLCGQWIAAYGFRNTYLIVGGIGLVISMICALFLLRTKPEDKGLRPLGAEKVEKEGAPAIDTRGMTLKEMVKTPQFVLVYVIVIGIYFAGSFMQDVTNMAVSKGFDIEHASVVSTAMMLGIVFGKIVLGILNDHIGTKTTLVVGALFGIVSFAFLVQGGSSPVFVYVGGFLFGACCAAMSVNPAFAIKRAFGNKEYAKIYSYAATAGVLTSAVGHPIYAAVYDLTGSYNGVMVACIIALVIVIVLTYLSIDQCRRKWDK